MAILSAPLGRRVDLAQSMTIERYVGILFCMLPERLFGLPYLVHTNRELGLMLRGDKPLAYFMGIVGHWPDVLTRYFRLFDRRVVQGRLSKKEYFELTPELQGLTSHRLFYALPGEEWRIDAMLHLLREPGVWTRERERRFGELLGYEQWQNDYWLERCWTGA